jgi:glycosyltransferase involved in cell wall biosynthesis
MLMDKELQCDFVFGDTMGDVKKMDYSVLSHFKKEIKNKTFLKRPLYYQCGVLSLLKEDYTHFIMLGNVPCISTWVMILLSRLLKKKIYLWSHGWYGKERKLRLFFTKYLFFNLSTGVFLYGNYAKNLLIASGVKTNKLHVIYNSLDYDEQLKLRKQLQPDSIYRNHFHNDAYNLVFVGRLTSIKRLDILLNALNELNKPIQKFNLTLIGNGEMKDELILLAQELKIENNIWFYGELYNEKKLSELLYNADLCVSPGNVGLTAIHAMTYGCPVVTHNNFSHQMPEFEAIITGETGAFFEYNNLSSLVAIIQEWFSKNFDRGKIRNKCYKVIDTKYNPYYQINLVQSVINQENND